MVFLKNHLLRHSLKLAIKAHAILSFNFSRSGPIKRDFSPLNFDEELKVELRLLLHLMSLEARVGRASGPQPLKR